MKTAVNFFRKTFRVRPFIPFFLTLVYISASIAFKYKQGLAIGRKSNGSIMIIAIHRLSRVCCLTPGISALFREINIFKIHHIVGCFFTPGCIFPTGSNTNNRFVGINNGAIFRINRINSRS